MLYFYALTDEPERRLPALCGLEQAGIFKVPYRDLAAVVSNVSTAEIPPLEPNVWRHELVIEGVMADRAVLPVRFGTVFASERAAEAAVREYYPAWLAALNRVRDRVEMSVRVLRSDEGEPPRPESADLPSPEGAGRGRAYLLARLAAERELRAARAPAEALAAELHAPLAGLATESTCQVLTTPRLLLTGAYLLERDRLPAFRSEAENLSTSYRQLRFLCTGPWPPYNFVSPAVPSGRGEGSSMSTTDQELLETDKVWCAADDLQDFADEMGQAERVLPRRLNVDTAGVEQGLAKLVLTVIELLRRLLEHQALRRVEGGSLSDEEIERLGDTFIKLSARMDELKVAFGLEGEELNLNLGPLGDLM